MAALAQHWSEPLIGKKKRRIGITIVENGYLPAEVVESEARVFHDDLDVVEVVEVLPRSERTTLPSVPVTMSVRPEA
ncbi:MAG: hypothetical protein JNL83_29360 [Myxococcales bacterium]|nr:hypothetical protein [Myxococcales bacterium]